MDRIPSKINNGNQVAVTNDDPHFRIQKKAASRIALNTLNHLRYHNTHLSLVFTSDSKIKRLNQRFLKHNRPTDVLAFPFHCHSEAKPKDLIHRSFAEFTLSTSAQDDKRRAQNDTLGEVIISPKRALVQAPLYGASFKEELVRYICHGILHLAGYRDKTKKERDKMRRAEDKILVSCKSDIHKLGHSRTL